jgi:hypothetical protein
MSVITQDPEELLVEVLFRLGIGKGAGSDLVKEGEVGGRVLFGSCLSSLSVRVSW